MSFTAMLNGCESDVEIVRRRPALVLRIGGRAVEVVELPAGDGAFDLLLDGTRHRGWCYRAGDELHLRLGHRTFVAELPDRHAGRAGAGSGNELRAEMPGTVVDIACSAGSQIAAGQTLLTVESMKMQTILAAPFDAVVETVHVTPNASFERNALLVTLKPV